MPHSSAVVVFSLLHFPRNNRWKALTGFVRLRQLLPASPGVQFAKVMGCGRGAVFSVMPDWSRYAFLSVWNSAEEAQAGFDRAQWKTLENSADRCVHLSLSPVSSHGLWDGINPFETLNPSASNAERMAVLTRADVKLWKVPSFSRHASSSSAAVEQYPGLQFSLGMGEWPFVRQATFSIWDSEEAMKSYAYKAPAHIAAMRGKNREKWYGEELYARFRISRESSGSVQDLFSA